MSDAKRGFKAGTQRVGVDRFAQQGRVRYRLVLEKCVRNAAPDRIGIEQAGFPVARRDAAYDGAALTLRTDRRSGFDPAARYMVKLRALRDHGMFQPEAGSVTLALDHATDAWFFTRPETVTQLPSWREALRNRATGLAVTGLFLAVLLLLLGAVICCMASRAGAPTNACNR